MSEFYKKYPYFDWEFYISCYADLRNAGITTEQQAIHHYAAHGYKECRRTHSIIKSPLLVQKLPVSHILGPVTQGYVSKGLQSLNLRFMKHFNFQPLQSLDEPCVFFGVYDDHDLAALYAHQGLKYIIWGGEDANPANGQAKATLLEVHKLHNVVHLAISKCLYERLTTYHFSPIYVDFNLVDTSLFYPVLKSELGRSIYIFNGQTPGREHIYGKSIYEAVMKRLPKYRYILSNQTCSPYESMPGIYKQCFIILRLTSRDGNANSVQECEAMGIPVVHNQSDYGLKWESIEDVVQHIVMK
jgi:hypothetical protein